MPRPRLRRGRRTPSHLQQHAQRQRQRYEERAVSEMGCGTARGAWGSGCGSAGAWMPTSPTSPEGRGASGPPRSGRPERARPWPRRPLQLRRRWVWAWGGAVGWTRRALRAAGSCPSAGHAAADRVRGAPRGREGAAAARRAAWRTQRGRQRLGHVVAHALWLRLRRLRRGRACREAWRARWSARTAHAEGMGRAVRATPHAAQRGAAGVPPRSPRVTSSRL